MVWVMGFAHSVLAQEKDPVTVKITDGGGQPLVRASVDLLKPDSSVIKYSLSDTAGLVQFKNPRLTTYLLRVSMANFKTRVAAIANDGKLHTVVMTEKVMTPVLVSGTKSPLELKADRMIMNVDAGISNAGTTLMELLERLPGVTTDADGNITLKGKTGVMVTIDGRPTYLTGVALANLLNGMTSSQVSQVEVIDNPSAGIDASGSGVINIKTKKGLQKGFNGSVSVTGAQGRYPKTANSLSLNLRTGKLNTFLNYTLNTVETFTKLTALRTYFKSDGTVKSILDQPSHTAYGQTAHNLRTGLDFSFSPTTSLSLVLMGQWQDISREGDNSVFWKNPYGNVDSVLRTTIMRSQSIQNKSAELSFSRRFTSHRELSANLDLLGYNTREGQYIQHDAVANTEAYQGSIPSDINIVSAQVDYSEEAENVKWQAGAKTAQTRTDNLADYYYNKDRGWLTDTGKTNHFIYRENIHALYVNGEGKWDRWTVQGGLRYEGTNYKARQFFPKDSSFTRSYGSLFPSLSVSFEKDSSNTFTFAAGRRIDRPKFEKFNPFVIIINKYTYQQGNPYLLPPYSWNLQLSHSYKNTLLTSISYSLTTDYIMQVFPAATNGIVIYTEGNLGRMENTGASVGLQKEVSRAWSFVLQAQANHKHFKGLILGALKTADYTQYTVNLNNAFRFGKGWTGEVSGVYLSSRQEDIQEVLDPSGQVIAGLGKSFAQGKGSVKFTVRDIFHTNLFKGFSQFSGSNEYFRFDRDTRYASLTLTWRFGKAYKTIKRSEGSARDEMERATSDRQ